MVKCKVIVEFYDNVEGINRKKGEEFECSSERAEYLLGKNENKLKVVDVIEVIPEKKDVVEILKPKIEEEYIRIGKTKLSKVIENGEQIKNQDETIEEKPKRKKKQIDTVE